ncbi:MAG: hypothetical protein ACOVRN_00505 [Flavobacterium sp.]
MKLKIYKNNVKNKKEKEKRKKKKKKEKETEKRKRNRKKKKKQTFPFYRWCGVSYHIYNHTLFTISSTLSR